MIYSVIRFIARAGMFGGNFFGRFPINLVQGIKIVKLSLFQYQLQEKISDAGNCAYSQIDNTEPMLY